MKYVFTNKPKYESQNIGNIRYLCNKITIRYDYMSFQEISLFHT